MSAALTTAVLVLLPLATFSYAVSGLVLLLVRQARSPLRRLRGPPPRSFFMGNLAELHDQENTRLLARWEAQYGSTYVYHGFVGGCRLLTTDPLAIAHILGHAYDYPKPEFVRDGLAKMAAGHDGILVVEGEQHRRQRKILTPAFSSAHIKSLAPVFWHKACQLRDIWLEMADTPAPSQSADAPASPPSTARTPSTPHPQPHISSPPPAPAPPTIDVLAWLTRATLDVIGLAGFGHTFDALVDDRDELARAFATIFSTARRFRVITILQVWFPFLRRFRRNSATMVQAKATMDRIGLRLIAERSASVAAELAESKLDSKADDDKTLLGRDLLSVLIRSNMASEPRERLTTQETLCQISTFLAAGHETTASALTWAFYALARAPRVQRKLRHRLRALDPAAASPPASSSPLGPDPDSDPCCGRPRPATAASRAYTPPTALTPALQGAIAAEPYLDAVVREVLRLHAPVTSTMRVAARAHDAVPVSAPFLDASGVPRSCIELRRHDIVTVPLQAVNRSCAVWGPDAEVFRPERWAAVPDAARAVPGLWASILTFGNGNPLDGNRACIGWRFALTEMKIFLYVLLRDLDVSIDPAVVIDKSINVVTRPHVRAEPEAGNQMPLSVRRVVEGEDDGARQDEDEGEEA